MKRTLLYSLVAVALGIALTLAPPIVIGGIETENRFFALSPQALSESFGTLEGDYTLHTPSISAADVEGFALSFAVALVAYVIFKRRTLYDNYE